MYLKFRFVAACSFDIYTYCKLNKTRLGENLVTWIAWKSVKIISAQSEKAPGSNKRLGVEFSSLMSV